LCCTAGGVVTVVIPHSIPRRTLTDAFQSIGIAKVDTGITEPGSFHYAYSSTGWVTLVRDLLDCSWDLGSAMEGYIVNS